MHLELDLRRDNDVGSLRVVGNPPQLASTDRGMDRSSQEEDNRNTSRHHHPGISCGTLVVAMTRGSVTL
jgi:hypothetical protein